ncbi:hypothetical protein [Actinocrispum sp. NPDC049592]|uniref:hypothetical protein n=1 Tax=Actinocrispum sp. NPDC049592 TaxID=3154835 RepID=UPI00343BB542
MAISDNAEHCALTGQKQAHRHIVLRDPQTMLDQRPLNNGGARRAIRGVQVDLNDEFLDRPPINPKPFSELNHMSTTRTCSWGEVSRKPVM